jgi:hypothetical protein
VKKPPTAEQLTSSAWAAALATKVVADTIPEGWQTVRQIAAELGKSRSQTGKLLSDAIADGRCLRQDFRVNVGGKACPVPHYKLP